MIRCGHWLHLKDDADDLLGSGGSLESPFIRGHGQQLADPQQLRLEPARIDRRTSLLSCI
jgi:hypothetical protein